MILTIKTGPTVSCYYISTEHSDQIASYQAPIGTDCSGQYIQISTGRSIYGLGIGCPSFKAQ